MKLTSMRPTVLLLGVLLCGLVRVCAAETMAEVTEVEAKHWKPGDEATAKKELASMFDVSGHVAEHIAKEKHQAEEEVEDLPVAVVQKSISKEKGQKDPRARRLKMSGSMKSSKIFRGYGNYRGRGQYWKGKGFGTLFVSRFCAGLGQCELSSVPDTCECTFVALQCGTIYSHYYDFLVAVVSSQSKVKAVFSRAIQVRSKLRGLPTQTNT